MLEPFFNVCSIHLICDLSSQTNFNQILVSAAAVLLDQCIRERGRIAKPAQPYYMRLSDLSPMLELQIPAFQVLHPVDEVFGCHRGIPQPNRRHCALQDRIDCFFDLFGHRDLTIVRFLEIRQGLLHHTDQYIVPLELLQQHNFCRRWFVWIV